MSAKGMGFLRELFTGRSDQAGSASVRQLVPENLDLMRVGESVVEPKGQRLIDRLQVQRISEEGGFPGGKSIPELPPVPGVWQQAYTRKP